MIVWRGDSLLTGGPVIVTATAGSANAKTGPVVSTYILPARLPAVRPHASVCPDACPLRDTGGCYVNWAFGPRSTQAGHKGERVATPAQARDLAKDRVVRIAQAGDPAAVPAHVWRNLLTHAHAWTGYTHAWRQPRFRWLQTLCMASVESPAQARQAQAEGWRTYRVRPRGSDTVAGELDCPATRGVQCSACRLCNGAGSAPSISIPAHGGAVAARVAQRIAE